MRIEAWKGQDFNGVWTRYLAIAVRRSDQLSYEAIDVGSWLFVSSNEPVKNEWEVIYEMFHILNCGFWNQVSYVHRSYKRNCLNCLYNCDDHSLLKTYCIRRSGLVWSYCFFQPCMYQFTTFEFACMHLLFSHVIFAIEVSFCLIRQLIS